MYKFNWSCSNINLTFCSVSAFGATGYQNVSIYQEKGLEKVQQQQWQSNN